MIEINLVPEQFRKKKKSANIFGTGQAMALPKEVMIGIVSGLSLLLIMVHILLQFIIIIKFVQLKKYRNTSSRMSSEKTNVDRVVQELKNLQDKFKSVEQIAGGKDVSWSKKLNQLSDHLPRGVWLNRMTLDGSTLLIQGSAVSKDKTEMINVHNFTNNLKADGDFMASFNDLELGLIKSRMIGQTPVADFTIRADLKDDKK
jgi:Tfp pilus assembly protein PilN